jgi:hypothetical protein
MDTALATSDEAAVPLRRQFKPSELPLNSAQRSSIDSLLTTIKKKGEFDAIRKNVWNQWHGSVSGYLFAAGELYTDHFCSKITQTLQQL